MSSWKQRSDLRPNTPRDVVDAAASIEDNPPSGRREIAIGLAHGRMEIHAACLHRVSRYGKPRPRGCIIDIKNEDEIGSDIPHREGVEHLAIGNSHASRHALIGEK